MPAKKYRDELRKRAVRMVLYLQADPTTARGARTRVAQQLGINKDTLRNWVEREQIDTGIKPGVRTRFILSTPRVLGA